MAKEKLGKGYFCRFSDDSERLLNDLAEQRKDSVQEVVRDLLDDCLHFAVDIAHLRKVNSDISMEIELVRRLLKKLKLIPD